MAAKTAASFDEIIQADRQRRKNEALAKDIFGKGRKASTPGNGNRKLGTGPSLASRVGISKPSQRLVVPGPKPKADVNAEWSHDLHKEDTVQKPQISSIPRNNPMVRINRNNRLYEAITARASPNGMKDQVNTNKLGEEINIRGLAGPYVVIGTNFASGTTAADIESAMVPSGGEMQRCRIVASDPTVIAEMVFAEKANAERVIATFNNKRADGRILHLYLKQGGLASPAVTPVPNAPSEPRAARKDVTGAEPSYDIQREQSDRNRRRADPEFQDGSYGFEPKDDKMDLDMDDRRDTWSDAPKNAVRGRNSGYRGYGARGRDDRRLYSDDLYPPRGRGFR